jgi:hypothetical protein
VTGDEYFVYPGENGPALNILRELYKKGIEDFELISMMRKDQNGNDSKSLLKAIELATRNPDGRNKNLNDVIEARDLLIKELF